MLNGLLLLDKPTGLTSHDVVAKLRHILRQKSIGHTGTLDPLATGLLVMVLGEATKLSDYLLSEDKEYAVTIQLGITTDTLDREGQILTREDVNLSSDTIEAAALKLQGEFQWPVPIFSAVKVEGKKLYEHGRKGRDVETPVKKMGFWDVRLKRVDGATVDVVLKCSKGSFIRTWASKLGEALGTGAVVSELRRLSVGTWRVEDAITLPDLQERAGEDLAPLPSFIPLADALPGLRSIWANAKEAKLVCNGQIPKAIGARLIFEQKRAFELGTPVFVKVMSSEGDLLALLSAEEGQGLRIRRVFRTFA